MAELLRPRYWVRYSNLGLWTSCDQVLRWKLRLSTTQEPSNMTICQGLEELGNQWTPPGIKILSIWAQMSQLLASRAQRNTREKTGIQMMQSNTSKWQPASSRPPSLSSPSITTTSPSPYAGKLTGSSPLILYMKQSLLKHHQESTKMHLKARRTPFLEQSAPPSPQHQRTTPTTMIPDQLAKCPGIMTSSCQMRDLKCGMASFHMK